MKPLKPIALLVLSIVAQAEVRTVTAYCPCKQCCGPTAPNPTASGTWPKAGRTVAANWMPLGTKLTINGIEYTVEDRMSKKHPQRVDIFFATHSEAVRFGKQRLNVHKTLLPHARESVAKKRTR